MPAENHVPQETRRLLETVLRLSPGVITTDADIETLMAALAAQSWSS